jgi:hypothetical protein
MQSRPTLQHLAFIAARESTPEIMTAEKLRRTLVLVNQSQLVRNLIEEKSQELGVI